MSLKFGFILFLVLLLIDLPGILSRICHKGGHKCKVNELSPVPVDLPRLCGDNIIKVYKNICDSVWERRRRRRGKYTTVVYYLFWCHIGEINGPGAIWEHSLIYTVRSTVDINPSRKRRVLKTLFKLEEFEKRRLRVLVWTGITLKTESKNDDVMIISQIQNDWWLLRFQISLVWCGGKTSEEFPEWNCVTT